MEKTHQQIGQMSKRKGSRVERELAKFLRDRGCLSARRTQQFCGAAGTSDILADELQCWHIESKGTKSPVLERSVLKKWWSKILSDKQSTASPVILNKANGKEPVAIIDFDTWRHICRAKENFIYSPEVEDSVNPSQVFNKMLNTQYILKLTGDLERVLTPVIFYSLDFTSPNLVLVMLYAANWLPLAIDPSCIKGGQHA